GCRLFDDGRPMPVERVNQAGQPVLEVICTAVAAIGRRPPSTYRYWHLVPIMLNALSRRFVVEVQAGGGLWRQEYSRGLPTIPLSLVGPNRGIGTTLT